MCLFISHFWFAITLSESQYISCIIYALTFHLLKVLSIISKFFTSMNKAIINNSACIFTWIYCDIHLHKNQRKQLLCYIVNVYLVLLRSCQLWSYLPKKSFIIFLSTIINKKSACCSTAFTTLGIDIVIDIGHSNCYIAFFNGSYNLWFLKSYNVDHLSINKTWIYIL